MHGDITILHLSDAHIGQPNTKYDQESVFGPLFTDLSNTENDLKPDLIVFTGDLVYGTSHNTAPMNAQFNDAKNFIFKLYEKLKIKSNEVPIIIVPGNHDINRSNIDEPYLPFRDNLSEDKITKLLNENGTTWMRLIERQKEWVEFFREIKHDSTQLDPITNMSTTSFALKGTSVGVIGFNTSWLAQDNYDSGKIWLGIEQYQRGYLAIKDCKIKIAVAHHPTDCLHPDEKNRIKQKIQCDFDIFFHGHEHSTWFEDIKGHFRSAAGACYCGSSNRGHGYSWMQVDSVTGDANIRLREYTDQGGGGWRANHIPEQTDKDGKAVLFFLKSKLNETKIGQGIEMNLQKEMDAPVIELNVPKSIAEFCITLDHFHIRKECAHAKCTNEHPHVYWPVRLREPAPIHAAQAFLAGGFNKLGCDVSLWLDDLGNADYSQYFFESKLKQWFERAGGDPKKLLIRKFSEILTERTHTEAAWDVLQKWLGTTVYRTDDVLRISKIWPSTDSPNAPEPSNLLKEMKAKRPRRLMNPSMVWTCLRVLQQEIKDKPILTLGGHDEQNLWDAWYKCCDFKGMQVCHLYVPKLTRKTNGGESAIHMKETPLAWKSKEDIEQAIQNAITEDDSPQIWSQPQSMVPWVINNCVLVPRYITNDVNATPLIIKGCQIRYLKDFDGIKPSEIMHDLVQVVHEWIR